jgi:NADH-quinone oxidoreductase subunit M
MLPLLSSLILLPLAGAALIALVAKDTESGAKKAKWIALVVSFIALGLCGAMVFQFDNASAAFQFHERYQWLEGYEIYFHLGIDGISLWLMVLTAILIPICILCSFNSITKRVNSFMIAFLVLEALVFGVFSSLDALLFYLFFEAVLIPMYLIIGIWGGENRIYAAYKFFLYTLAGSVLFLIAILYLYFTFGTMDIPTLIAQAPTLSLDVQRYLWWAMLASFAVKVPIWPLHTWLPDAHVQAPTAGSVILAGILLKMGGYGFMRFSLPMLPGASLAYADFMYVISVIAVIYTSLVALAQTDMKKLIAYSSVAHMGFVTLGLFSFNQQGIEGAYIQMISHGIVSGALFLCVGSLYDRLHTKEIAKYGGVVNVSPYFAAFFMVFTMASVGLPGTSGFVGEMLVLIGAYSASPWAAIGAATGLVLGAAYMLRLYRHVMFGEVASKEIAAFKDASRLEWAYYLPLVIMVIGLGVYPSIISKSLSPSVLQLIEQMQVSPANQNIELLEKLPEISAEKFENLAASIDVQEKE